MGIVYFSIIIMAAGQLKLVGVETSLFVLCLVSCQVYCAVGPEGRSSPGSAPPWGSKKQKYQEKSL